MSSSTSSSDGARRRRALALGGGLFGLLAAVEVVTRVFLFDASKDLRRFVRYPAEARALAGAPGLRVALVGNSTTDAGIDPRLLGDLLTARLGQPVRDAAFVADGAGIGLDTWMVDREFWKQGLAPDLFVVTYYGHDIEDGERMDVGRLAQFFVGRADWPAVFDFDLPRLEQRADLILSSAWATFAVRDRIKERVLDLIPGYQKTISEVNAANFHHDQLFDVEREVRPRTHEALRRFVGRARQAGASICFVAYPSLMAYEISPEAREIVADAGYLFLDLRQIGLGPEHYADNIHVNAAGQQIFTHRLADALAEVWHPHRR
jgi:hypothetical protein